MRFQFHVETKATPEQTFHAFTDFSRRRLDVWSKSLNPDTYELLEQGDTWAIAKEGSPGMRIFTIWHYDWSEPEVIRWTAKRLYRGGGQITIAPTPEGGSALDVVFAHRHPEGVKGALALSAQRMIGPRIIPRQWQEALDRLAETRQ
jgi:hypothetical protein